MKYQIRYDLKEIFEDREIYRIEALRDIPEIGVKEGDIGGFVSNKHNLSQEGNCWIFGNAKCLDDAKCLDNSIMHDNSVMLNNAIIYDDSEMYDNSRMFDNSTMYNNSATFDNSRMFSNSTMYNNSKIFDNSKLVLNMKVSKSEDVIFHKFKHNITIADNKISIGCKSYKSYKDFLENYLKDGKENKYSDYDLKYLKSLVKNSLVYLKNK